jgi:shikimate dehydrogenase
MTPPSQGRWPSASTVVTGVIGDPIAHSLSPLLFNTAFAALGLDWVSEAWRVPAAKAPEALGGVRALGIAGISVTMPHKQAVAHLVEELSEAALRLDAVNCVVNRGGRLRGENTDGTGFLAALARGAGFVPESRRCLVVGAGGAARAVVAALADAGAAEVIVVNRTPDRAGTAAALAGSRGRVGTVEEARDADLVVNATPAGMASTEAPDEPLVGSALLGTGQVACDLVYHPLETTWLRAAAARGATTLGGLGMLVHQAGAQLTLWTGEAPPIEAMWAAAASLVGATGSD